MGCGASSVKDTDKWELFLARARNSGLTSGQLLKITDENARIAKIESMFFTHEDAVKIVKNWNKLKDDDGAPAAPPALKHNTELPQNVSQDQRRARQDEVDQRKLEYVYTVADVNLPLPPNPEGLPKAERKGADHAMDLFGTSIGTRMSLDFNATADFIHDVFVDEKDPFKDWRDLYRTTDLPAVFEKNADGVERWRTDQEFGRQRLNGVNPTLIRLLHEFPAKFPVTEETVKGVLPDGVTLAQMIAQHKIFWTDYEWLDGLPAPAQNNITAPIAAFYVDKNDDLMPLAIQLSQKPGRDAPIFTPKNCSPTCWLLVKMHVNVADAFLHEVSAHFLATHAIMELVYVAMKRTVSDSHPIAHMLAPHFWFTMALNWSARRDLISPGGAVPRLMVGGYEGLVHLMSRGWESWTFTRFDVPFRFERRGIWDPKDPSLCPKNYYRDDSLKLWNIILQFTTDMVGGLYKSDKDVEDDSELAAWIYEMTNPLMLGMKGLPLDADGRMRKRQQLALFLAEVIFCVSAGHAAVNNAQFDIFGSVTNSPGKLKQPAPRSLDYNPTLCEIAAMLPGYTDSTDQIVVVKALSSPPAKVLGQYPDDYFATRPELKIFIQNFKVNLSKMSEEVKRRNGVITSRGELPYPYLDPGQVSMSVAV